MTDEDGLGDATRRAVLKATAGALGVAGMSGAASAHGKFGSTTAASGAQAENRQPSTVGTSENAEVFGYHSIGGVGTEGNAGRPENAHYGGLTEIRTHGDVAFVGMFSSRDNDVDRGLAIVDISQYNDAQTTEELELAEMSVVSYFRNLNQGTAVMDVKVSQDGDYVFLGTQPITALFGETTTSLPTRLTAESTSGTNTGGVVAVDVSDRANPTLAGAFDAFSTGIHNLFHHEIDGTDYVFACKDIESAGDAGLYIFEFDRTTGQLVLQARYTPSNEPTTSTPTSPFYYCHDVEVQNDPRTGTPTAYVAYWNAGVRVLDVSDPANPTEIGHFDMDQAHFTTPAPELVPVRDGDGDLVYDDDGSVRKRRVAIASHEEPSAASDDGNEDKTRPNSSGVVFLVDAEGIYEESGVTDLDELDNWVWLSDDELEQPEGGGESFVNYELSPHNSDAAMHPRRLGEGQGENFERDRNGDVVHDLWVHQAHYHGGLRYLRATVRENTGSTLEEEGFSRPTRSVPEESKMTGLSGVTPFMWGAKESGGVSFAADINQGVFAIKHDDIALREVDDTDDTSDGDIPIGSVNGVTGGLTLGTAAGIVGVTARKRDRLRERFADLFE